jgi:hypothetical protein
MVGRFFVRDRSSALVWFASGNATILAARSFTIPRDIGI